MESPSLFIIYLIANCAFTELPELSNGGARLNGRVLNNFWFPHEEFARGGLLELWLGPKPNTRWGTGKLPE